MWISTYLLCVQIVTQLYENSKRKVIYHQIRIPAVKLWKHLTLLHFLEQSISQKIGKCT